MTFQHAVLENGLQIVAETNPAAQSVALGFIVNTGSRDEADDVAGVSHFLEHMAFKGDEEFSADDVNRIFDELGASYNASTSEEITVYYAAILPEYLDRTFNLLSRLMRPSLREDDFNIEKQVILEEIGMYQDLPAFAVHEHAMGLHFSGHPLGHSILGSNASITALNAAQMKSYHATRYGAGNLVLAAAGNFDFERLKQLAEERCGHWERGVPGRIKPAALPHLQQHWNVQPALNQEHIMQLADAPSAQNDLRFAAEITATIIGDDGAGRLYWELIETGLAESADLNYSEYDGSGAWSTYLCCLPQLTRDNLARIAKLYETFNQQGPTDQEFEQARNKVATRIVLAGERPMSRFMTLGGNWVYRSEYRSIEDDLRSLRALRKEDVLALLKEFPLAQTTTVGLGPLSDSAN